MNIPEIEWWRPLSSKRENLLDTYVCNWLYRGGFCGAFEVYAFISIGSLPSCAYADSTGFWVWRFVREM